jgi:branched-chain amino acid transport system permease protein
LAFTIGAAFAGVAGSLFSHYFYIAHPATFTFMKSFDLLTMVVLGGLGSMSGAITGAILLTFISAALASYPEWRMVIYSLTLIILMIYRPQGLFGNRELSFKMFSGLIGGGKRGTTENK